MDLALQTGWPRSVIAMMPERELEKWDRYAQQKGFPFRRLEYALARVCALIDVTMGGAKSARIQDYLFPVGPPDEDAEISDEDLAELKAAIGFDPD